MIDFLLVCKYFFFPNPHETSLIVIVISRVSMVTWVCSQSAHGQLWGRIVPQRLYNISFWIWPWLSTLAAVVQSLSIGADEFFNAVMHPIFLMIGSPNGNVISRHGFSTRCYCSECMLVRCMPDSPWNTIAPIGTHRYQSSPISIGRRQSIFLPCSSGKKVFNSSIKGRRIYHHMLWLRH